VIVAVKVGIPRLAAVDKIHLILINIEEEEEKEEKKKKRHR